MREISRVKRKAGRPGTGQTRVKLGIAITEVQYAKLMQYCKTRKIGTSRGIQMLHSRIDSPYRGQGRRRFHGTKEFKPRTLKGMIAQSGIPQRV